MSPKIVVWGHRGKARRHGLRPGVGGQEAGPTSSSSSEGSALRASGAPPDAIDAEALPAFEGALCAGGALVLVALPFVSCLRAVTTRGRAWEGLLLGVSLEGLLLGVGVGVVVVQPSFWPICTSS